MDEQEREALKAELRAELKAELESEQDKARKDAAFGPVVQSANRERTWEQTGASTRRPSRESAATILGAALADQMLAGLPGTPLDDDGYGDGT